jgi:hypothetical protein
MSAGLGSRCRLLAASDWLAVSNGKLRTSRPVQFHLTEHETGSKLVPIKMEDPPQIESRI